MSAFADLVRAGDTDGVAAALASLTPEQRRAELPALRERRKELRGRWTGNRDHWTALLVAGAGCHTAPSAAADWLAGPVFESMAGWNSPRLREVVDAQPAAWRAEVAARLADRPAPRWDGTRWFPLTEYLIRSTGGPVPETDGFAAQWLRHRSNPPFRGGPFEDRRRDEGLYARLAADSFTPVLVPVLFRLADIGGELDGPWSARDDAGRWPAVLARLAAEGVVERAVLLDHCLARLLRGGARTDQRAFLKILQALAPTDEEYTGHVRTLLGLLEGDSTVAGHAQQVLAALDAAGRIGPDLLGEASPVVLFRPEKKLVRAQLSWLDRAARTAPDRAGPVVEAAACGLGHPDRGLQEQALKVVARHLPAAGDALLPVLRDAAALLDPAHHARAAELFGAALEAEPYEEVLPPVPQPRPVPPPIASAAELAEELGAVLAGDPDPSAWERVLDGLVRHAAQDRAALAEALAPVLRTGGRDDLLFVAEAAADRLDDVRRKAAATATGPLRSSWASAFDTQFEARTTEAARQLVTAPVPCLLATPTLSTGALDPSVLAARIAVYERDGAEPGPVDLAQALLRVTPTADPQVTAAARALRSPAGERLARWLLSGGLPHQESTLLPPSSGRHPNGRRMSATRRMAAQPGAALDGPLPTDVDQLLGPTYRHLAVSHVWWQRASTARYTTILPHHREEVAARLLDHLAGAADLDERGGPQLLPHLAESGGPAGLAVHLALAYGLGARHREDRAAAVDALLVLAARRDLDAALLGRETAELVRLGTVKATRAAEALRSAAETGAHGTVWSVLAGALPVLLPGEAAVRGVGALLALAVDCGRRCGARGEIPGVAGLASAAGSSQAVREARALREVLAG